MPVSEKVGIPLTSLILVFLMALSSVSPILIESALIDQTETYEKIVSFSNTGANQPSNNSTVDTDDDGLPDTSDSCPDGSKARLLSTSLDYDNDGCVDKQWIGIVGLNATIVGVEVDSQNRTIVYGTFTGSLQFGQTVLTNQAGSNDGFVARLSSNLEWDWATQLESSGQFSLNDAAVNNDGSNIVVIGKYAGYLQLGTVYDGNQAWTHYQGFVATLNETGHWQWMNQITTTGPDLQKVAIDDSGAIYIGGNAYGSYVTIATSSSASSFSSSQCFGSSSIHSTIFVIKLGLN